MKQERFRIWLIIRPNSISNSKPKLLKFKLTFLPQDSFSAMLISQQLNNAVSAAVHLKRNQSGVAVQSDHESTMLFQGSILTGGKRRVCRISRGQRKEKLRGREKEALWLKYVARFYAFLCVRRLAAHFVSCRLKRTRVARGKTFRLAWNFGIASANDTR